MSTLDQLQVLSDLISLYETAPQETSGVASTFWDDLIARIKKVVKAIIDGIVGTAGTTLSGIQSSIKSKIDSVGEGLTRFVGNVQTTLYNKIGTAKGSISDWIAATEKNIKDKIDTITSGIGSTVNGVIGAIKAKIGTASGTVSDWINSATTTIKTKVGDAVTTLDGIIGRAKGSILSGVSTAKDAIQSTVETVEKNVKNKIDETLGGLGQAFKDAIGWVRDKLTEIVQGIKDTAKSIGESIAKALQGVGDWIGKAVSAAIEGASSWITDTIHNISQTLSDMVQSFKDTIGGVIQSVRSSLETVYNSIKESVTGVIEQLKSTFEKVKETLEDKIQAVIDWLRETARALQEFFWATLTKMGAWIAENFLPLWEDAVDWAQKITGLDPSVIEDIKKGDFSRLGEGIGNIFDWAGEAAINSPLFALATAIARFWNAVALQFVPAQVAAQKQAIINLALEPISLGEAAQAVFRGKASEQDYYSNAYVAGVAKSRAKMSLEASRALVTPGAIQAAFLRGEISIDHHDKLLGDYGYTKDDIDLFKSLYMLIPGPSDLVRMAVREAFSPDIAEKFGQYEDYPEAFTKWALKQGISEEWAQRYWAAHWDLPSPQMGFEMLHRGIIDDSELTLLLRALDVMPYWRERLIQISYNPLTRVDVRRMYKIGVIDETEVYKAYLDLGYNETNASRLTEFTKRYYTPEDETEQDQFRALARSTYSQAFKKHIIGEQEYRQFLLNMGYFSEDVELLIHIDQFAMMQADSLFDLNSYRKDWLKLVLQAYDRGLVTTDEISQMLADLGYEDSQIVLELNLLDYNRTLKLRNILVEQIHDQYVNFIIDIPKMSEILQMFNFTPQEMDKLQEEWDLERNFRTKRPSLTDLKKFFEAGLLTLDQLLDELRGIGYNEKYIPMFETYFTT